MFPLQAFFLISVLVIFPLAWLGGGHTERAGVALFLPLYILSYLVQGLRIGDLMWGIAATDLIALIGLVWLSLTRERWWPLVAAGFQILIMFIYVATVLIPDLTPRAGIAASWALNIIVLYTLLGGVLERWLAGEAPVSASAVWTRRRPPPAAPNS